MVKGDAGQKSLLKLFSVKPFHVLCAIFLNEKSDIIDYVRVGLLVPGYMGDRCWGSG